MKRIRRFPFTPLTALVFLCALAAFGAVIGLLWASGH